MFAHVMVNVKGTLSTVGGQLVKFGPVHEGTSSLKINRNLQKDYHNTSIRNLHTNIFESTNYVGLKKYRKQGHSAVYVDIKNLCGK